MKLATNIHHVTGDWSEVKIVTRRINL